LLFSRQKIEKRVCHASAIPLQLVCLAVERTKANTRRNLNGA
jgi:hypothetical protein